MTNYIILKATNEPASIFAIVGEQEAVSQGEAIRKFADEEGVYAAVPMRSWEPQTVAEAAPTTPRFKVTPLAADSP